MRIFHTTKSMFVTSYILSEQFYSEDFLERLNAIPGKTWRAAIPDRFKGYSKVQIKQLLAPLQKMQFSTKDTLKTESTKEVPELFDWLLEKPECVKEIRDQGACGSCWAFAGTSAFSDRVCINSTPNVFTQFSEQLPVSCDTGNWGCDGGAFESIHSFFRDTGMVPESCVAYKSGKSGQTGKCPTACDDGSAFPTFVKSKSYTRIAPQNERDVREIVLEGPVHAGIDVYEDFMYYSGGIYKHESGKNVGAHALEIVGWGEEDGTPYWRVKNSWGETFGENGFIRILRGTNEVNLEGKGSCCIGDHF